MITDEKKKMITDENNVILAAKMILLIETENEIYWHINCFFIG